jgi:hypothetical protein
MGRNPLRQVKRAVLPGAFAADRTSGFGDNGRQLL